MNNKLSSPFKNGTLMITQTTHGQVGQLSIDCNKKPFTRECYMEGDGTIGVIGGLGSTQYIWVFYDGIDYVREFVHFVAKEGLKTGQHLKRGDLLGYLYWDDNFPTHLHWTFYDVFKHGNTPNPFDYLDRSTKVDSPHSVIKNEPSWFNKDGSFNWSSFADLTLDNKEMAFNVGDRVEFKAVSNLRHDPRIQGEAGVNSKVLKGAVGEIIPDANREMPRHYPQGGKLYLYYNVRLIDDQGWIIDANMVKTIKPMTKVDGTIPTPPPVVPPVVPPIQSDLEKRVSVLERQNKTQTDINRAMSKEIELLDKAVEGVKVALSEMNKATEPFKTE